MQKVSYSIKKENVTLLDLNRWKSLSLWLIQIPNLCCLRKESFSRTGRQHTATIFTFLFPNVTHYPNMAWNRIVVGYIFLPLEKEKCSIFSVKLRTFLNTIKQLTYSNETYFWINVDIRILNLLNKSSDVCGILLLIRLDIWTDAGYLGIVS